MMTAKLPNQKNIFIFNDIAIRQYVNNLTVMLSDIFAEMY